MDYVVWTILSLVVVLAVLGLIYGSLAASTQVVSVSVKGYSLGNVLIVEVSNVGSVSVAVERVYLSNISSVVLSGCIPTNKSTSTSLAPGASVMFIFVGSSCSSVKKVVVVTDKGVYSGLVS